MAQTYSSLGSPPANPAAKLGAMAIQYAANSARFRMQALLRRNVAGIASLGPKGRLQLMSATSLAEVNGTPYLIGMKGDGITRPIVVGVPEDEIIRNIWQVTPSPFPDGIDDTTVPTGAPFPADVTSASGLVILKDATVSALPVAFPLPFDHTLIKGPIWDDAVYSALKASGPLLSV